MGFYPPDALVHEAQRRGIEVLRAGRQRQRGRAARSSTADGAAAVRIGLGYVLGVAGRRRRGARRRARGGGPFRTLEDLASRAGAGRAGAGAARVVGRLRRAGRRRPAPRAVGARRRGAGQRAADVGGRRVRPRTRAELGTQLALPLGVPEAPALPGLTGWEAMIADYATTGLTTAEHPLGLLRAELRAQRMVASGDLERLGHGTRGAHRRAGRRAPAAGHRQGRRASC